MSQTKKSASTTRQGLKRDPLFREEEFKYGGRYRQFWRYLIEEVSSSLIGSPLKREIWRSWSKILPMFALDRPAVNSDSKTMEKMIFWRALRHVFHNFTCAVLVSALNSAGVSASCQEPYLEMIFLESPLDLSSIKWDLGLNWTGGDILADGETYEVKTTYYRQYKQEDYKSTLVVSTPRGISLWGEMEMFPPDVGVSAGTMEVWDILHVGWDLVEDCRRINKIPVRDWEEEDVDISELLEKELPTDLVDSWWNSLVKYHKTATWEVMMRKGKWMIANCQKIQKAVREEMWKLTKSEKGRVYTPTDNGPEVWRGVMERIDDIEESQDSGSPMLLHFDSVEGNDVPDLKVGRLLEWFLERGINEKPVFWVLKPDEINCNPAFDELEFSCVGYKAGSGKVVVKKRNQGDDIAALEDIMCKPINFECPDPGNGPHRGWTLRVIEVIERLKWTRAAHTLKLNAIAARFVCQIAEQRNMVIAGVRYGPGAYILGIKSKGVVQFGFLARSDEPISGFLKRPFFVERNWVWQPFRTISEGWRTHAMSWTKPVSTAMVLMIEGYSKKSSFDRPVTAFARLVQTWYAEKTKTVQNIKGLHGLVGNVMNEVVVKEGLESKVPKQAASCIDTRFWGYAREFFRYLSEHHPGVLKTRMDTSEDFPKWIGEKITSPSVWLPFLKDVNEEYRMTETKIFQVMLKVRNNPITAQLEIMAKHADKVIEEVNYVKKLTMGQRDQCAIREFKTTKDSVKEIMMQTQERIELRDTPHWRKVNNMEYSLLMGAIYVHENWDKIANKMSSWGQYDQLDKNILHRATSSSGIVREDPKLSKKQIGLALDIVLEKPNAFSGVGWIKEIIKMKPMNYRAKLSQKDGEGGMKVREFQVNHLSDYTCAAIQNSLARVAKTNIITRTRDKGLQQQQLKDQVLYECKKMKDKGFDCSAFEFVTDISQWSPTKNDAELLGFIIPQLAILERTHPKLAKLIGCTYLMGLERELYHGVEVNKPKSYEKVSVLDHPTMGTIEPSRKWKDAMLYNGIPHLEMIRVRYMSTMGQTHPVASDMQMVCYSEMLEAVRKNVDKNCDLFTEWECDVSADDIILSGVGSNDLDLKSLAGDMMFLMEMVRGEEASAHKTTVSKGLRSSFLGTESLEMRFLIDKLSGVGVTTVGSLSRTPGLSACTLWGSASKHAVSGVSTVCAYMAYWGAGLEWIKWAFDLEREGGTIFGIMEDLPCTIVPCHMKFEYFASGMTLPECDVHRGVEGNRACAYLGTLDRDFSNPTMVGSKDKLPFLTGLKVNIPRKRNRATGETFERIQMEFEKSDIIGGEVAAKKATDITDPGFVEGISALVEKAGGWVRLDQGKELAWIFRNKHKEIVKMGKINVTIFDAVSILMKRSMQYEIEELQDYCTKLFNFLFPDGLTKMANIKAIEEGVLTGSYLKLQPVEPYPSPVKTNPNELAFIIKNGLFNSARLGVIGNLRDVRNDTQRLKEVAGDLDKLSFDTIVSLCTAPTGPSVAYLGVFRKKGVNRISPRTAVVHSTTDNLIAGLSVQRPKGIAPPREGTYLTQSEVENIARFALMAVSYTRGSVNEKIQTLENARFGGRRLDTLTPQGSRYHGILCSLMREEITQDRYSERVVVEKGQIPVAWIIRPLEKDDITLLKEKTRNWGKERERLRKQNLEAKNVWLGDNEVHMIGFCQVSWKHHITVAAQTKGECSEIAWYLYKELLGYNTGTPLLKDEYGWFPQTKKQLIWQKRGLNDEIIDLRISKKLDKVPVADLKAGRIITPIGTLSMEWDMTNPGVKGIDERIEKLDLLSTELCSKVVEPEEGQLLECMSTIDSDNLGDNPLNPLRKIWDSGFLTPVMLSESIGDLITVKWLLNQKKPLTPQQRDVTISWKILELLMIKKFPNFLPFLREKLDDENGLEVIQGIWGSLVSNTLSVGRRKIKIQNYLELALEEKPQNMDEFDLMTVRYLRKCEVGKIDIEAEAFLATKPKKNMIGVYVQTGEIIILAKGKIIGENPDDHYLGDKTYDIFFGAGSSEDD
ncbi:RNA-directed RNA polymerase [Turtle fraservirus 1]|uniref:RNA-directed RNA polymerase n=1 Tax=Turtle fraservirus 1 TaxID=2912878 RepID=UPI0024836DFA|nr:RNA-directed RNA polymerase [Turtle fraservirus 1]UJT32112.1 RNA-directed RNA polymerase [Turtle fraservirus 1]